MYAEPLSPTLSLKDVADAYFCRGLDISLLDEDDSELFGGGDPGMASVLADLDRSFECLVSQSAYVGQYCRISSATRNIHCAILTFRFVDQARRWRQSGKGKS